MSGETTLTEAEWLTSTDPMPMLDYLDSHDLLTDRTQRLHDCACVRRIWHLLLDEHGRRAVETAERFADDMATLEELREAQGAALAAADAQATLYFPGTPNSYTVLAAAAGAAWEFRSGADPLAHAAGAISWEGLTENGPPKRRLGRIKFAEERANQAALVRDLFGNPFRPVTISPAVLTWNAGLVVRIAQAAYEERPLPAGTLDNGLLAILADALEEAGCTDTDILGHLRGSGPHVRGCWPVDLCLGKS
jgi:hypothetical protein